MSKLFTEFEPSDKNVWYQLASKEIKGKDFIETLGWKADSNLVLDPLYTFAEFAQSNQSLLSRNMKSGWTFSIPLDLSQSSVHEIIKKIEFLQRWDALAILIEARTQRISQNEMQEILSVCKVGTSIFIKDETERLLIWYYQWVQVCQQNEIDTKELKGGLLANPSLVEDSTEFRLLKDLFKVTASSPDLYLIGVEVDSTNNMSGDLSTAISSAHECLCGLGEKGIDINRILNATLFDVCINQLYIEQAAKLRTLRELWGNICSEYGIQSDQAMIMTKSSGFPADKVHDDNLIRETLVAMSSVLGGSDIINISPVKNSNDALRWAMNIHHLLKNEARLDLVADMAGGSYAIEKLTSELSKSAWEKFIKKEEKGGRLNG
jgi:methylmalonyl-CoA mutase